MRGLRPRSPITITAVRIVTVYLWLGITSAVLALMLTPLVGRVSTKLGLVDAPGGRKVHARPVPRLGGVAVVGAAVVALAIALWRGSVESAVWTSMQPFAISGAIISYAVFCLKKKKK